EILVEFAEVIEVAQAGQRRQPALGENVVVLVQVVGRDHQEGAGGCQQEGRDQAANAPRIEGAEAERAFVQRAHQQLGDDMPGNNEEDVDTNESAGDAGKLVMIGNDQNDGQGA